ncbi:MAG TPA: hypothetical protein VGD69_12550 [Herpetosiphonaceae bacterium]
MRSLRSITLLLSLLTALLTVHVTPSTATTIAQHDPAATGAADCATETTYCAFLPLTRFPVPPPTLQELARIPGDIRTVELEGSYAYIGSADVVYVVDVSNPGQPRVVGGVKLPNFKEPYILDIEIQPPLAYVSTIDHPSSWEVQIHLLNIAQPAQPRWLTAINSIGGNDIEVVDQRVYATSPYWIAPIPDLAIADVVNGSAFQPRGSYGTTGSASVAVKGSIAYLADYAYGIHVVDISDPDNPVPLGTVSTPEEVYDAQVDGSYLYATWLDTLAVYDISTPETPVLRSTRQLRGFPTDLEVANGWAYATFNPVGLSIVDVRDPDYMEIVTTYPMTDLPLDVEVDGSLIYLATSGGLQILRVTPQ